MSDLKKTEKAFEELDSHFKEYKYKVQELEDICEEFEKQAILLSEEKSELLLLLRQVKHHATDGNNEKVLSLLEVVDGGA